MNRFPASESHHHYTGIIGDYSAPLATAWVKRATTIEAMDLCGIIPGQNCHWSPFFSGCSLVWVPVRHRILSLSRLLHCRSYYSFPASCAALKTCGHLRKVIQQCTAACKPADGIAQADQGGSTDCDSKRSSTPATLSDFQKNMLGRAPAYRVAWRHYA